MFVRLGFAVAAHCDPDILLVDEVLSVGDVNFQRRCMRHIRGLMDRCAVILVSHFPNIIRLNCNKVLFLHSGKTQFLGASSDGVDQYTDFMERLALPKVNTEKSELSYDSKTGLKSFSLLDKNFNEITEIDAGETLVVECAFFVVKPIRQAIIGIQFWLDCLQQSFVCYSSQVADERYYDLATGEHTFRILIPKIVLQAGTYNVGVRISEKNELAEHAANLNKYLIVKNPHPEFGLYDMRLQFSVDEERPSSNE